jgi:cytochrome P450
MFARLIVTLTIGLCLWPILSLLKNYRRARKVGLPILVTPIPFGNPLWQLSESYIAPLFKLFPSNITSFMEYSTRGWYFDDKYRLHSKYGEAFMIVGPDVTQIVIADTGAAEDVLSRRKDFVKAHSLYGALEIFGRNVDTVNGEVWQRHRRITTPPFNERNSGLVWTESRKQADDMLKVWIQKGQDGVPRMDKDFMTLALHVLCQAGFGQSYAFGEGVATASEGHTMSYRDSLKAILDNLVIVFTVASKKIPTWMVPAKVLMVQTAFIEFKQYMAEMVEAERTSANGIVKDNLMSSLFRASEVEAQSSQGRNGLTDEEIFGNLFIYNLAGHDTTAMTMVYAIALLSSDAHWQSWVGEELASVFGVKDRVDYEETFPKLKRCLAVMVSRSTLFRAFECTMLRWSFSTRRFDFLDP